MKKTGTVALVLGAVLSLFACMFAFGAGNGRPTCAVMAFEGAQAEDAGLAVLVCSKFSNLMAKSDRYDVMPRLTVNKNLADRNYDRGSHKSTLEAGVAAGKMLNVDYMVAGDVEHSADGYVLQVSLVEIRTGKTIKSGRTKRMADMREFTNKAAQDGVELLVGSIESTPAKAPAVPVAIPVVKKTPPPAPRAIARPVTTVAVPKFEPVAEEPATVAASKAELEPPVVVMDAPKVALPKVTEPPSVPVKEVPVVGKNEPVPVPTRVVVPEPVMDLTPEEPQSVEPVIREPSEGMLGMLAGHLQVGTRVTAFSLLKDRSNSFIGSIQELDAVQDYMPTKVYVDCYLWRYLGVELTWDDVRAKTGAQDLEGGVPHHTDGDFIVKGPILSLIGRYPNSSKFTPYAGVGMAFLKASFLHAAWWRGGFESEGDWIAAGSPDVIATRVVRTIEPNNTHGGVLFAGCDYSITDNLRAGVYGRYMTVNLDTHYYLTIEDSISDQGRYLIPMTSMAYGLGVSYVF